MLATWCKILRCYLMMQYIFPRKLAPNSPVRPQLQLLDNGAHCLLQKQNLSFLNFLCCEGCQMTRFRVMTSLTRRDSSTVPGSMGSAARVSGFTVTSAPSSFGNSLILCFLGPITSFHRVKRGLKELRHVRSREEYPVRTLNVCSCYSLSGMSANMEQPLRYIK